jgi:hypothetical protein
MTTNGTTAGAGPVPGGTRVISTTDGEDGTVLNAFDAAGREYEIETRYGVERWRRDEFVTFAEAGVEARDNG